MCMTCHVCMVWTTLVTPAGGSISVIFLPVPGGFFIPDRGGAGGGVAPLAPDGGGGGGGGCFKPVEGGGGGGGGAPGFFPVTERLEPWMTYCSAKQQVDLRESLKMCPKVTWWLQDHLCCKLD